MCITPHFNRFANIGTLRWSPCFVVLLWRSLSLAASGGCLAQIQFHSNQSNNNDQNDLRSLNPTILIVHNQAVYIDVHRLELIYPGTLYSLSSLWSSLRTLTVRLRAFINSGHFFPVPELGWMVGSPQRLLSCGRLCVIRLNASGLISWSCFSDVIRPMSHGWSDRHRVAQHF